VSENTTFFFVLHISKVQKVTTPRKHDWNEPRKNKFQRKRHTEVHIQSKTAPGISMGPTVAPNPAIIGLLNKSSLKIN
jgi:hypothetical protein